MADRRNYTNQSGYICPTENQAIRAIAMEETRLRKRRKEDTRVLTEQDCQRMGVQQRDRGGERI